MSQPPKHVVEQQLLCIDQEVTFLNANKRKDKNNSFFLFYFKHMPPEKFTSGDDPIINADVLRSLVWNHQNEVKYVLIARHIFSR